MEFVRPGLRNHIVSFPLSLLTEAGHEGLPSFQGRGLDPPAPTGWEECEPQDACQKIMWEGIF